MSTVPGFVAKCQRMAVELPTANTTAMASLGTKGKLFLEAAGESARIPSRVTGAKSTTRPWSVRFQMLTPGNTPSVRIYYVGAAAYWTEYGTKGGYVITPRGLAGTRKARGRSGATALLPGSNRGLFGGSVAAHAGEVQALSFGGGHPVLYARRPNDSKARPFWQRTKEAFVATNVQSTYRTAVTGALLKAGFGR